ncbi:sugar ABC transporter permease [Oscillospiraceae bacterium HV4-5-C5C]|nr:sugar ABC transporter permease [Oscillospiraceae bacterium HV4-5-C5C]
MKQAAKQYTGSSKVMTTKISYKKDFQKYKSVYLIALICLLYYFIFCYAPMGGILIAFKNYRPARGIWGSDWVGLRYFKQFFSSHYFYRLIRNTLLINVYDVLFGFPAPIILALLLNELTSQRFKKTVQTITYLPYFISLVVVCGIILDFLSVDGLVNQIIDFFGGSTVVFLQNPKYFRTIYVVSGIWQNVGYGSIIYLAALSAIDTQLLDASAVDGCNRFQRIWHVTLPGIAPTIIIMLILRLGSMMNVGFEKVILLYNESIYETSDVISSFVYRYGILQGNYSYSTAVGLFNSLINFALLIIVNQISKKVSSISIW